MGKTRQNYLVIRLLAGLGGIAGVTILYFFPPAEYSFYPRCIFHWLTGWNCPGCGSLRAIHQLLHGNFASAFQLNPLLVVLLPLLGIFALRQLIRTRNEN